MAARASTGRGTKVVYDKEGVDPCKCRAVYTVLPHTTASVFVNDDAGLWAGCTTAPDWTPVLDEGQGLAVGKLGRRAPDAKEVGAESLILSPDLEFGLELGCPHRLLSGDGLGLYLWMMVPSVLGGV
jgi:hypothetical protein